MYGGCSVAVVVPAYNEAGFVGDVIRSVPPYVDRIYAIDDDSTDDTWADIREAAREVNQRHDAGDGTDRDGDDERSADEPTTDGRSPADSRRTATDGSGAALDGTGASSPAHEPRVVPVRHKENRGVGGAIKTGYRLAVEDGYDVTAVMAGDGQMDPDRLDGLLDPIVDGRADYAKGNRLVRSEWRAEMPRFRLVGNTALTLLTKVASGYWRVGDPQNGYTAVSREALETAEFERMYEFYGYCNDFLVRLGTADARVADVPIPPSYGDEQSHIDLRTYVPRVSGMLLRTFAWRLAAEFRRDRNPASVLYPAGAVAGLLAVRDVGRRARAALDRGSGADEDSGRPVAALLVSVLLLALAAGVDWARKLALAFRAED